MSNSTWKFGRRAHFGGPARGAAAALFILMVAMWALPARAGDASPYGPFGPESSRLREQLWILPSADENQALRATVFRPASASQLASTHDAVGADAPPDVPRPLVVINHGTSDLTREAVSMPVYYWLSRWFVERGYVVVLPQRRGHGATGGPLVESIGSCVSPNHFLSGLVAADDIAATVAYISKQPFVDPRGAIVVGISTGGWASLALASRNLPEVRAVVNIAGGRGGHAGGRPHAVCHPDRLIEAVRAYGGEARVPTLWLYAENDSYFGPELATAMAQAWQDAGGSAELNLLPPYADEGHTIAEDRAGWDTWGPALERFLDEKLVAPRIAEETLVPTAPAAVEATTAPIIAVSGESHQLDH